MKLRRGAKDEEQEDDGPADPYAELFRLTDQYKANAQKKEEEGNVTNSLAMLTAIPEVDLGMECVYPSVVTSSPYSCAVSQRTIEEYRRDREGETTNLRTAQGAQASR